jgi:voltage-gated potassium channel
LSHLRSETRVREWALRHDRCDPDIVNGHQTPSPPTLQVPATNDDRREPRAERLELLEHVENLLEPLLALLGFVFLALLLADLAGAVTDPAQRLWLERTMNAIWIIFLVDFLGRLVIAPAKPAYLRRNWLTALSLALPFLRPLRALGALKAVRSLSLVRLLGGVNRGMRVLQAVTRGRQFAYVAALTIMVALAGAAGALYFERGVSGAPIQSFEDALWWSSAMVTTINNEKYVVSTEARVMAILIRIFAVSVFGFVTASIASYFIGRTSHEREASRAAEPQPIDRLATEIAAMRRENEQLRREVAALREAIEERASSPLPPGRKG